jgi:uncharacterized protein (DUF2384 family)
VGEAMARESARKSSTKRTPAQASARSVSGTSTSNRSRGGAPRRRPAARDGSKSNTLSAVGEADRLERLVSSLGNNRVAQLMSVSPSQPSRWRSGKEHMGPASRRAVLDLDYVWGRLLQLYPQRQAEVWLSSPNAHLGARPVDVLRLRGAAPVIDAIDAEEEGAFA